jgi:hypothetical protein
MNFHDMEPMILSVVSVIITGLIGWAATLFQSATTIKIQDSWREAIHSAAMTGITAALHRFDGSAGDLTPAGKTAIIGDASNWVLRSVPEAVKGLGLDKHPDKIRQIVESKLGLLAQTPGTIEAGKAVPNA